MPLERTWASSLPGRQTWRLTALLSACLAAVSGCHIPGLRCADSGPVTPASYNGVSSAENSGHLGIQEFFDDAILVQLISEGLMQNQELKIRNQEVMIASNEILSRRGAYLPFVTGGLRGGFDRTSRFTPLGAAEDQLTYPGGGRFPDPLGNVNLSANLFWEIDIWRRLRNARDAAIQRYCEAVEARNYLITQIVAEIATNYYELAALDQRLVYLDQTIALQQKSLEVSHAQKDAGRATELPVQRFLAEVRRNESQRLIVRQQIIETENRINFLTGRYPQHVDREQWDFIRLDSQPLQAGIPSDLLRNRRDIIAAEYEVAASGLDVLVAKANFYPRLSINAGVGFEAFNPRYLFDPGAFIAGTAGELAAPLINKRAIQAEYKNANARQLQAIYNYQRTVLNAFTEVVNSLNKVENFRTSVAIKHEQVQALESSVDVATQLFQNARPEADYIDVLFSQRDLLEARTVLIETKQQQLSAIVAAYQALGGGYLMSTGDMSIPGVLEDEPTDLMVPPAPAAVNDLPKETQDKQPPAKADEAGEAKL